MNPCSAFYENLTTKSLVDEPSPHIRLLLLYSGLRKLAREKSKVIWKRVTCDNEAVRMQAM